jgi:hypothetical protein
MVDKKVEMSQKAVRMARHQNFQMAKWSKKKARLWRAKSFVFNPSR